MRASCGWSDASILNLSSHGLQIDTVRAAVQGRTVEIWHEEHVIVARVVWRKGRRAGLVTDQRVPVEELVMLSEQPQRRLNAAAWPEVERRKTLRRRSRPETALTKYFIRLFGPLLRDQRGRREPALRADEDERVRADVSARREARRSEPRTGLPRFRLAGTDT
jgi:hypothetical protein